VPLPDPVPGLVLRYSYLWHDEHLGGREEGSKDRPCVIVLVAEVKGEETIVTVARVTHSQPRNPAQAVELPAATRQRLGLDDRRSWVVVSEINRFCWPGPDLRPVIASGLRKYDYGMLPPRLFRQITSGLLAWAKAQRLLTTIR
jgi:hypothetical protein